MTPRYTVTGGRDAAVAAPAMPFRRAVARVSAPLLPPGRLADALFARGYRRVKAGRAARAIRFEIAERCCGDDLVTAIDPSRLRHELVDVVSAAGKPVRLSHWFLDGGDWTRALRPLLTSKVGSEIDAVFDHGDRLEEAPAYRFLLARSEAGRPADRNGVSLTGPDLIRAYLQQYVDLKRSIERHGYRPRAGVPPAETRLFAGTAVRAAAAERIEREVGIAVGADGTPVRLVGGRHRTAIARRLKLPRIPVQVRLVHVAWLDGWIARTGLSPREALAAGIRGLAA